MVNANGMIINYILSTLAKKNIVPSDFHAQASVIKNMMSDDVSGLVQSLTDFQVSAANVKWYIKTESDTLNSIMTEWLDTVNSEFNGKIPSGIRALSLEYYKERWKGASFPILKILSWGEIDGFQVPTKLAFVDGSNVYAETKRNSEFIDLGDNRYYLGQNQDPENLLDSGCIISKPFGRWTDEYPPIYLIKSGVYHNWSMLASLKGKQSELLDQVLPYLLLVQKGTENLALQKGINYDDTKLKQVANQMDEMLNKLNDSHAEGKRKHKTPIRVSQFDEEIKHLLPDLGTILKAELASGFEKGILAGQGFIDIADAVSSSRRESVMNPKAFIQETRSGIGDGQDGSGFAQVMKDLMFVIKRQNKGRTKYNNLGMNVYHSQPQIFMDKDFRDFLLSMFNRGKLSQKTLIEVAGDQCYHEEVEQRKREAKSGNDFYMYPPVTQNQEVSGNNEYLTGKNQDPEKDMKVPEEKMNADTQMKYNKASIDNLELAAYKSITKLPKTVKEAFTSKKDQRKWLMTWNSAYAYALGKWNDVDRAETYAFSVAWGTSKRENNKIN